jgi:predicted metal-binding membrane protein
VPRHLLWRHPEWWSIALCAGAWLTLIIITAADAPGGLASAGHAGHAYAGPLSAPIAAPGRMIAGEVGRWLLMVVAMMVPFVLGPIRTTAARSLWCRRHRAIGAFLAGYLLPWLLCGVALAALGVMLPIHHLDRSPAGLIAAFALAAAWQHAPAKRRALVSCHATRPLAPRGWQASRDCVMFGSMVGLRCVVTCWTLMLVCVLAGHSLTMMAGIGLLGIFERSSRQATGAVTSGLLAAGGALYLIAAG